MKILAVSANEKSAESLSTLIKETGVHVVMPCSSATAARRAILDEEWDLAIINYPLSDEPGLELAHMITEETDTSVIMLMKGEYIAEMANKLEPFGIIAVEKPILKPVFRQSISLAMSIKRRLRAREEEIQRLKLKIEEQKIINRAKCLLIEKEGLTEADAHKNIERTSMDRRITLKESALLVLRRYKE